MSDTQKNTTSQEQPEGGCFVILFFIIAFLVGIYLVFKYLG